MALNAKDYKLESKFERPDPLEAGTYPGRVVWVISKGLQKQDDFKGEEKAPKHELYIMYELLDEFLKDEDGNDIPEKPRFIGETFTMNSLDSDLAKSTKRYYALDPSMEYDGDWSKLAGTPCMITIIQNASKKDKTKVYNNITGISTMRDKDAKKAPELVNEPKVFDIDDPDMEVFMSLPLWLQDNIKENLEFGGSPLEKLLKNVKGSNNIQIEDEEETPKSKKNKKPAPIVEEPDEEDEEENEDW